MARPMNKPEAADTAGKESKPAEIKLPKETTIYLGPNHPQGFLSHGQVFKPPLAVPVAEVFKAAPEIMQSLFVPLAKLPAARQALNDTGSDLVLAYQKAVKHLAGGKQ
jgi:hypothetical protein